jgi:(p)ppGpp synthase/HD superfamily hydrolase
MNPTDIIKFAETFAKAAHGDQNHQYDNHAYSFHLERVVGVLLDFEVIDKNMLAAAYLHDIIEDCGVSEATIKNLFGDRVAELVYAVTDEPGANRKERKEKTYKKILSVKGAVQLKLADRIANVTYSIESKNRRMFLMYDKEHSSFRLALHESDAVDIEPMWKELEMLLYSGRKEFKNANT